MVRNPVTLEVAILMQKVPNFHKVDLYPGSLEPKGHCCSRCCGCERSRPATGQWICVPGYHKGALAATRATCQPFALSFSLSHTSSSREYLSSFHKRSMSTQATCSVPPSWYLEKRDSNPFRSFCSFYCLPQAVPLRYYCFCGRACGKARGGKVDSRGHGHF